MKKAQTLNRVGLLKTFAIIILIAAIFAISMPVNLLVVGAKAEADERTQEAKNAVQQSAAIDDFTLTINYFRKNADYAGWNMWLWTEGGTAITDRNEFTDDVTIGGETWKSLSITVSGAEAVDGKVVGFIVRTDSWQKDPDGDRFVTESDIAANKKDGKVTLYLISETKEFSFNETDGIAAMREAKRAKITQAQFTDFNSVRINTSQGITTASYFKVKDSDNKVIGSYDCKTQTGFTPNVKYLEIALEEDMVFNKTYTVVDEPATFDDNLNFSKQTVRTEKLFSTEKFKEMYQYEGELGAKYSAAETVFTVWSPYASAMKLNIYSAGDGTDAPTTYDMNEGLKGTWTYTLTGDQKNKYYTYTVINGTEKNEVVDPYARSGGKNGKRGMIADLASLNPEGWATQAEPTLKSNSEAVIWEAQLRDVTIHESSGVSVANRGKFLGLTETGTKNSKGQSTALDHLKNIGVTQVHFQPLFDFASVDESFTTATYDKDGQYNWGYDPLNYNMPEGSYSSDPSDGTKRVNEMKQMVMALHNAGIQVVMDVVYNHVSNADASNFEKLMPGYYFRKTASGSFYNGSGCGNETASDRYMFRKFMIDSVLYWTQEYKIDGFRFDLMGLHDIDTMNALYDALKEVNPDVIVYGEGWTGGDSGLDSTKQAILKNAKKMPNIAFFDDIIRDGLKGSVFSTADTGYISGKKGTDAAIYVGAAGGTAAADYSVYFQLGDDKKDFAANPTQNINYTSCHDNSLLWDKLNASVNADRDTLKAMNRMAAVSVLTSQGIAFFPAGEEMLRSKPTAKSNKFDNRATAYKTDPTYFFADNSYRSPDSVNAINWELLDTNADMVDFYKALIGIKKTWPQFQITSTETLKDCLKISDADYKDGVASYSIKDPASNNYAVVVFNNSATPKKVSVPNGSYDIFVNGNQASTEKLSSFTGSKVTVGAYSAVVMRGAIDKDALAGWTSTVAEGKSGNLGLALGLGIGIPAAVLIAGGVVFGVMYAKKKKGDNGNNGGDDNASAKTDDAPQTDAPAEEAATQDVAEPEKEPAPAEEAKAEEAAAQDVAEPEKEPAPVEEAKAEEAATQADEPKAEEAAAQADEPKAEKAPAKKPAAKSASSTAAKKPATKSTATKKPATKTDEQK